MHVYFQTQPALMCLIQELCKSGNTKVFYFIDHANQVTKKFFFSHYLSLVFYKKTICYAVQRTHLIKDIFY